MISRDLFILVGSSLYLILIDPPTSGRRRSASSTPRSRSSPSSFSSPGRRSRGIGSPARRNRGENLVRLIGLCAMTTAVSGAQYLYMGIRKLSDGQWGVRVDSVAAGGLAAAAGIRRGTGSCRSRKAGRGPSRSALHDFPGQVRRPLEGGVRGSGRRRSAPAARRSDHARADPGPTVPQPVHLLLRPPAPEGPEARPVRQGRGRPSLLPARAIRDLSDLSEEETRKIVRYRLSPLYVSIHTASPDLRRLMLGNPRARDVMEVMRRLTRAGIVLHGQIVVCPGINDGEELFRTLSRLSSLRPGLRTVAVVPVGLTSHRAGLPPLRPSPGGGAENARPALRVPDGTDGEPFAMAADEYYLLAGRRSPGGRPTAPSPRSATGWGCFGLPRRIRRPVPQEEMAGRRLRRHRGHGKVRGRDRIGISPGIFAQGGRGIPGVPAPTD